MTSFASLRILLASIFLVIVAYTVVVIANHGLGLFPIFFGDIGAMAWPGQFNLDFMGFLLLSGFWMAWRHQFSGKGLALGVCGLFLGAPMLTAYLFVASLSCDGDPKALLLGPERARAS